MALSRAQKKFLAIKRAQRRLQHRLEDIDWELDELAPAVAEIKSLESTQKVEIEVGHEAEDQD